MEEKFRKIKKTNKTISSKVLSLPYMTNLIEALGYVDQDSEFYTIDLSNLAQFARFGRQVDDELAEVKVMFMDDEEREKFIRVREEQERNREQYKKAQAEKAKLAEHMKNDRKENEGKEIRASKATEVNFGANVVKFKPPEPRKGGRG